MKRITSFGIVFSLLITPVFADDQKTGPSAETRSTLADFQKLSASFEQIKHAVQRELSLTETAEKPKTEEQPQPVAQQAEKVTAALEHFDEEHLDVREDELPKQGKSKVSNSEVRVWAGMLGISVFSTFIGAHLEKQARQPLVQGLDEVRDILERHSSLQDQQTADIKKLQQDHEELAKYVHEREQKARGAGELEVKQRRADSAAGSSAAAGKP